MEASMRVTPTNLAVAKSSAKILRTQLELLFKRELSLQKSRELYARSLGYANWDELCEVLKGPYEPLYLDDLPKEQQGEELWCIYSRLSGLLGYGYMHGFVISAGEQAALGYSIKASAAAREFATPWGLMREREVLAPGLEYVVTCSHGGYRLDEARRSRMDQLFTQARIDFQELIRREWPEYETQGIFSSYYVPEIGQEWYEEDSEACLVEAAFPELFDPTASISRLRRTFSKLMPYVCGISPDEYDRREDARLLAEFRRNPSAWFAIDDLGYQATAKAGNINWGYYALTGADALAWFVHQDYAASERGSFFVSGRPSQVELGEVIPDSYHQFPDQSMGRGPCVIDGYVIPMRKYTFEDFRSGRPKPARRP
jgi:hypothetical protein